MSFTNSVGQSFKDRGIFGTFQVTLSYIFDFFFDLKYGTDTSSWVELDDLSIISKNIVRGNRYQPTHALPLMKFFNELDLPSDKIIVDLGSGKGRVLLVASECGFTEAHGVEFSKELCAIAKNNISIFRRKTGSSTILKVFNADATTYLIKDDEDIFYLFNPFDNIILKKVIANIHESLIKCPRNIWILYFNAIYKDIIEKDHIFSKAMRYRYLGQEFLVYSNQST